MYYSSEMEWNSKWGWENLDMFNSKGSESLKKLQLTDWVVEDEGEIDAVGSFKMSGSRCGSGSGGSDSELVHGYSMKSSISASTESSPYEVMKAASYFAHEAYAVGSPCTFIKSETEQNMAAAADASYLENSFVSVEPLLGLKLGKRTYFENNSSNTSNLNSPISVNPIVSSASVLKKTKATFSNGVIPLCQVQGCNLDLSSAKEYHRKHRVCDTHSKSPKVIVGGMELRFCQQCSRFHSLSDFDEKKRSCRRRLSDHNARRRKPKQETLQFHSTKLTAPPLYDGMQQMSFSMDNNGGITNLEFPWKFEKAGQSSSMHNVDLPQVKIMRSNLTNRFSANNGNSNHVFTQGSKEAMLTFNSNAVEPEFPRALSLLSTKPWGSTEAECIMSEHHRAFHPNPVTAASLPLPPPPPPMQPAIPQGIALGSSDFWQVSQQQSNGGFQLHNFNDYCNNNNAAGSQFGEAHNFRS